jgi:hypothetical protein
MLTNRETDADGRSRLTPDATRGGGAYDFSAADVRATLASDLALIATPLQDPLWAELDALLRC